MHMLFMDTNNNCSFVHVITYKFAFVSDIFARLIPVGSMNITEGGYQ